MNSEKIKQGVKNFFVSFFNLLKKTWNFIKKIDLKIIKKIIGFVLVVGAGIGLFIETILTALVSFDSSHFENILGYYFDFSLFDYINLTEFYSVILGGYLLDIFLYSLVIIVGIWIFSGNAWILTMLFLS